MYLLPLIATIAVTLLGWAVALEIIANFLWELVRGVSLFSWWWVMVSIVALIMAVITLFISIIYQK